MFAPDNILLDVLLYIFLERLERTAEVYRPLLSPTMLFNVANQLYFSHRSIRLKSHIPMLRSDTCLSCWVICARTLKSGIKYGRKCRKSHSRHSSALSKSLLHITGGWMISTKAMAKARMRHSRRGWSGWLRS